MKRERFAPTVIVSTAILIVGITLGARAQDRFALKAPNGIAFSEFTGYEKWQVIASAVADNAAGCGSSPEPGCIKSILGNAVAIKAYEAGIPANGQPVPDGAMFAKIEWYKEHVVEAYGVTIPGKFMEVAFMTKDSKRFQQTDGWGYATLKYDAATDTFKAFAGEAPDFHKTACHGCHTIVRSRDFLFTKYPKR
jgi:Cytochrome P460